MHLVFIQIKTQIVITYSLLTQNPSGIEFTKLILPWAIQMSMVIIKNDMRMIQSMARLWKYGETNQVLMRKLNMKMEGENKCML